MFYRIQDVKPLPNMTLGVRFLDGATKRYDVKPLTRKWKPFEALLQVDGLFEQVRVDQGGYGVSWNDELDLSCNELWEGGYDPTDKARLETDLTDEEKAIIRAGREEYKKGEFIPLSEI